MYCQKCGSQNPDTGRFCRNCGTDLAANSAPLVVAGANHTLTDRKGKPVSLESSVAKIFTGLAFLIIACVLGYTNMAGGKVWWFWMLIPAFGSLGTGIAQYMMLKRAEKAQMALSPPIHPNDVNAAAAWPSLNAPPARSYTPESRYKTGDLVPPSVTEDTTRQLTVDSEGQTMTLPKKDA